jgi:hypothetical protein
MPIMVVAPAHLSSAKINNPELQCAGASYPHTVIPDSIPLTKIEFMLLFQYQTI